MVSALGSGRALVLPKLLSVAERFLVSRPHERIGAPIREEFSKLGILEDVLQRTRDKTRAYVFVAPAIQAEKPLLQVFQNRPCNVRIPP